MPLPEKLLEYYTKELSFLKKYGAIFNKKFPTIAKRLGFIDGVSEDPHVERLIESVALLTAQLQQRLDEDLSEYNKNILETLLPQFIRPIPSVSIVHFAHNPDSSTCQQVIRVPRHSLLHARTTDGIECRFRTCYSTAILPVKLLSAELCSDNYQNGWYLALNMTSHASQLPKGERLRIHLSGQIRAGYLLYEVLMSQVLSLEFHKNGKEKIYSQKDICAAGFSQEDCLFADDVNINPIHGTLLDYAVFPERFLFFDMPLPEDIFLDKNNDPVTVVIRLTNHEIVRKLSVLYPKGNIDDIKVNCVPIVSLFQHTAVPVLPDNNLYEYVLQPELRNPEFYEIYSVNHVELKRKKENGTESCRLDPLFGIRSRYDNTLPNLLWQVTNKKDELEHGEVVNTFLTFSEVNGMMLDNKTDIITAYVTCMSKAVVSQMTTGNEQGDFSAQVSLPGIIIKGLMRPRLPVYPSHSDAHHWRLVAQLSLNKILFSGKQGIDILKQTLSLYNVVQNQTFAQLIDLLVDIKIENVMGRLYPDNPLSLAQGLSAILIFHRDASAQPGFYLFCSVLEKYLGQYAPVNSFIQTTIKIAQDDEYHLDWPKRMGNLVWL
ncbi:type VI secretion system baseplate subunit TssF [Enterobacter asburiae]|uniref:type VI secretion system baseplate subunit TssF n=1 Tax=Enterobacter asburiae TaxID=61645 RepID=UPI0021CF778D|nr:type VI secretion system baseplate subunit TssF [Enterobacter asburiae]MCU6244130.1 type VI secretion system baseplate subunit TssF [Enterobacter asburiae]